GRPARAVLRGRARARGEVSPLEHARICEGSLGGGLGRMWVCGYVSDPHTHIPSYPHMVFHPPRTTGLLIALGVVVVLLGLDVGFSLVLRSNLLSVAGFLSRLLLLASLPVIAVVAYRSYGLLRSRYVLSRNAIVVEWGSRRIVLPMGMLDEARDGADVPGEVRPRGLTWPGSVFG